MHRDRVGQADFSLGKFYAQTIRPSNDLGRPDCGARHTGERGQLLTAKTSRSCGSSASSEAGTAGKTVVEGKTMKGHFRWTVHNIIGHPLSEIAHLFGLQRLSDWIHERTIPRN